MSATTAVVTLTVQLQRAGGGKAKQAWEYWECQISGLSETGRDAFCGSLAPWPLSATVETGSLGDCFVVIRENGQPEQVSKGGKIPQEIVTKLLNLLARRGFKVVGTQVYSEEKCYPTLIWTLQC